MGTALIIEIMTVMVVVVVVVVVIIMREIGVYLIRFSFKGTYLLSTNSKGPHNGAHTTNRRFGTPELNLNPFKSHTFLNSKPQTLNPKPYTLNPKP